MRINLVRICIGFILAGIVLFGTVQAALPLQVTVTATPSTLMPGGAEAQITVLVKAGEQVMKDAAVTLRFDSEQAAIVNPSSGTTDSSGMFFSTLSTLKNGGSIRVTAFAQKSTIDMSYEGSGYVDIPVQQVQVQPQPVNQPPPQPVYQPP
jgi:hypothetical protein